MLATAVMLGMATYWAVELVRRLPFVEVRALRGDKPWACNVCMSGWVGSLANLGYCVSTGSWGVEYRLVWLASMGAALLLLTWSDSLAPGGPALPPPG